MSIFLTIGLIELITQPGFALPDLIALFVRQMLFGAALGFGMGRVALFLINRVKLGYEGLYPALTVALVFLTFGLADLVGGSGFLAVYLVGIVLANRDFLHKRSLVRFHDGLAWLMQIAMFLTLGLLVFPSQLVPIIGAGLLMAACLMFLARPLSVFASLLPSALNWRAKAFISWVGLRGAVPIILATFPLLAGVAQANAIFNLVFFIVLTSVLLQGTSLTMVARWLKLDAPATPRRVYPIEYLPVGGFKSELKELLVPPDSYMHGKAIFELGLPPEFLIVLIARENDFMLPTGGTILLGGDTLLALADNQTFAEVQATLASTSQPLRT
jgi:cell volume regulation protein A